VVERVVRQHEQPAALAARSCDDGIVEHRPHRLAELDAVR
jgi:hypothetical protein